MIRTIQSLTFAIQISFTNWIHTAEAEFVIIIMIINILHLSQLQYIKYNENVNCNYDTISCYTSSSLLSIRTGVFLVLDLFAALPSVTCSSLGLTSEYFTICSRILFPYFFVFNFPITFSNCTSTNTQKT